MLEQLRELTTTASFNRWAGFEVIRVEGGECELRMVWRPDDMGQYAGFLHAGMIAALLDTACGFAATTTSGLSVLSSQFAMNCLAPAVGEEFVAIAGGQGGSQADLHQRRAVRLQRWGAKGRCHGDDAAGPRRLSDHVEVVLLAREDDPKSLRKIAGEGC